MKNLKLMSPEDSSVGEGSATSQTTPVGLYCSESEDHDIRLCSSIERHANGDYTVYVTVTAEGFTGVTLEKLDVVILPPTGQEIIRVREIIATLDNEGESAEEPEPLTAQITVSVEDQDQEEIITVTLSGSNDMLGLPKKPKTILIRADGL
jgi:hypothetical protein